MEAAATAVSLSSLRIIFPFVIQMTELLGGGAKGKRKGGERGGEDGGEGSKRRSTSPQIHPVISGGEGGNLYPG